MVLRLDFSKVLVYNPASLMMVRHSKRVPVSYNQNEKKDFNEKQVTEFNIQTIVYDPYSIQFVSAASRVIVIKSEIITITVHVA